MRLDAAVFILSAVAVGVAGALLSVAGNPHNTGLCISCFMENVAGALRLHGITTMQYMRPEIGFVVIGSFLSAALRREFRTSSSGALPYYAVGGFFMIIGCAVFIGCPIKLLLRLAGGDMTAVAGLAGLVAGVALGVALLKGGVDTQLFARQSRPMPVTAMLLPAVLLVVAAVDRAKPGVFASSSGGAASEHAPMILSAGAALVLGALSQYSRFCVTGSIRNALITRTATGFTALLALVASAAAINIATGRFDIGITGQPGSHQAWFWSFLGMALTGYIAVIIDGCPFRQLVKAGEGDIAAQASFFGMLLGGAAVQNFSILSDAGGPTAAGKIGLLAGVLLFALVTFELRRKS